MYKFKPLLKQTIWGGDRIIAFKHLSQPMDNVGESWEVSGVMGFESVVDGGEHQGKTLNQLVHELKESLVGKENYRRFGDEFPLLVKFIDACQDLSIQVHPDDETARRQGMGRGKTEMWYVLDSAPGARLFNGLKQRITPDEYRQRVADDSITEVLASYDVREGDVFYIPAGRIHAIRSGSFVAEIQQTSDVTYRIYDYRRRDKNGNFRELHTELAAESIDYTVLPDYRTRYEPRQNEGVLLVDCPYFTTAVYDLTEPMLLDYSDLDSFVILIAVAGESTLTADGESVSFRAGESVLLPAITAEVRVDGTVKFLETFV